MYRCSHLFSLAFHINFPQADHAGYTALHSACRQNNAPIVKLLADKGADIAVCLPCSTTPLLTVCRHGLSKEVLDVLCLAGADVNARDAAGMCALQVVAREGHASLAKRLLEAPDIDVKISCTDLGSPLHAAALFGHADVCELLLSKGADAAALNAQAKIPLQLACENLHVDACASLLQAAPLMASAEASESKNSMMHLVMRAGLERNQSKAPGSLGDIVRRGQESASVRDGSEPNKRKDASPAWNRLLQLLADHGCDVNQADFHGETVLHMAVQAGATDLVILLLSLKANPEVRNRAGLRVLHCALALGHAQIVEALLQAGADFPPREHEEAMASACAGTQHLQSTALIEVLLQHGVSFPARFQPESPLHCEPLYSACNLLGLSNASMAKILAHSLHPDADSGGNPFSIKIPKQKNVLNFPSFRYDFPILPSTGQGSCPVYWEVTLVTSELMQLGICSARWTPKIEAGSWGCGDDLASLAIDGSRDSCWMGSQKKIDGGLVWSCGDVLGIAVDFENHSVEFFLHGSKVTGVPQIADGSTRALCLTRGHCPLCHFEQW